MAPALTDWEMFRSDASGSRGTVLDLNFDTPRRLVVVATVSGRLVALDEAGVIRWRHSMGAGVFETPLISNDLVVASAENGQTVALAFDGAERWNHRREAVASGILTDGILVSPQRCDVVGLDARTGVERWAFKLFRGRPTTPVQIGMMEYEGGLASGVAFGAAEEICCIHAQLGVELWRSTLPGPGGRRRRCEIPPIITRAGKTTVLLVCTPAQAIVALDTDDGHAIWTCAFNEELVGPPCSHEDGTVVVATRKGTVWTIDIISGRRKLLADLSASVRGHRVERFASNTFGLGPEVYVVAGRRLFVVGYDHDLNWDSEGLDDMMTRGALKVRDFGWDASDTPTLAGLDVCLVAHELTESKVVMQGAIASWEIALDEVCEAGPVMADY